MQTYVLTLAIKFPATHQKKGKPTHFFEKYLSGEKKQTIRGNYELWKRRIDNINAGKAILSIREWTGMPYRSITTNGTGYLEESRLEKTGNAPLGWRIDDYDCDFTTQDFAANDDLGI